MGALVDAFPNGCMSVNQPAQRLGKSYEEALADLRRLGHGINFDTSEIPAELYDAHKLAGFELMCTLLMMADSFRAAVCLHQAAHAGYGTFVGAGGRKFSRSRQPMLPNDRAPTRLSQRQGRTDVRHRRRIRRRDQRTYRCQNGARSRKDAFVPWHCGRDHDRALGRTGAGV